MTNFSKAPVLALQRESIRSRFVHLILASLLLQITAAGAEPTAMPEVLTTTPAQTALEPLYQPMPTQSVAMPALNNWRDANTRVKELGGWMFYASEAEAEQQPTKQPAKPTVEQSSDPSSEHHHHHPAVKAAVPVKEQP